MRNSIVRTTIIFAIISSFLAALPVHSAPVIDEILGSYSDDFSDAASIAASSNAGVNAGALQLKTGGADTFTAPFAASGTVTFNPINPLRIARWGSLSAVASIPPGTSIKAQIYDDHGHLFRDTYLAGNSAGVASFPINLGSIPIMSCADSYFPGDPEGNSQTCNHPGKITVKFTLTTSDSSATPLIDSVHVTWTLRQGDNSSSTPAQEGWAANQHDQQGTFATSASNPAIYPAFRWATEQYLGDAEGRNLLVSGGKVFAPVGFATSRLLGLDADTGTELWQMPNGYNSPYGSISADGTFYGHDYDIDRLNAIDITTGMLKWSYNFYGGHGTDGAVIGLDGTVFTIRNHPNEHSATVFAFNPDGTTKWTNEFAFSNIGGDQYVLSRLSSAPDGTIYFSYHTIMDGAPNDYGMSYLDDSYLMAVDPANGTVKWEYQTGDTSLEAPVVGPDGTIYVAKQFYTKDHEVQVVAVRPDGTLRWRKNFGIGDFGFTNLALKNDGNLYALYSTLGLDYAGDMTVMELSKTDGSVLWSAPAGKSFVSVGLPYFTSNYITADGTNGLYYVDALSSDPAATFIRLNYLDAEHELRWQIPYVYDSSAGRTTYSLATQAMDDRGWIYSVLGKTMIDQDGRYIHAQQFAQPFALAPWTLTLASDKTTYYEGETAHFSVTTSMQEHNPLTGEDNPMQLILDNGTKVPLSYSSTNGQGDTVWTGTYAIPADFGSGTHHYTVEAQQPLLKTDTTTHFDISATGSENTGLTSTGTFSFVRHATSSGGYQYAAPSPSISLTIPAPGASLAGGSTISISWSSANGAFVSYRVSYSADNGSGYVVLSENTVTTSYAWLVPQNSTPQGLIKVEGLDSSGKVLATDVSDAAFAVNGTAPVIKKTDYGEQAPNPPAVDPTVVGTYDAVSAKANNPSINADKAIRAAEPFTAQCASGSLIRTASSPSVYYCGNDGKRYVFANDKAYFSWYPDFSTVQTVNEETMAGIALGGNVTYRPGSRMVKIQTDPKVYAVSRGGVLRWITSEAAAIRLYGAAWNALVDDVPDSFFANYKVGESID